MRERMRERTFYTNKERERERERGGGGGENLLQIYRGNSI